MNQPVQTHTMAYLSTIYTYDGAIRYWTPSDDHLRRARDAHGRTRIDAGRERLLVGRRRRRGLGARVGRQLRITGRPTAECPIAHIVSTPDGRGYWLVAGDGGIFSFGDATFFGSMGSSHLNAPVVDMAPTPDGHGYWLVASDGGIFSFGDATFHGSMGGQHLNQPIVGMSADDATGGYWLVATDGGIFSFDAPFLGSTGSIRLVQPVNGMASLADGGGYWFVAVRRRDIQRGDGPLPGVDGWDNPQRPGRGHGRRSGHRGVLAGGERRGHLQLRRPVFRRRLATCRWCGRRSRPAPN